MGKYSQLYNSSRCVLFTFFVFAFSSIFYWMAKFFLYRYVLMDDFQQVEHPRNPGDVAYVVEPPYVIGEQRKPLVVASRYPLLVRFLQFYQQFFLDYLPFLGMGLLNVVMFRSWAFNAVQMYLVLIPMWLFNVLKVIPPRFFLVSLFAKFWWQGWMLGFFINIWTIQSF